MRKLSGGFNTTDSCAGSCARGGVGTAGNPDLRGGDEGAVGGSRGPSLSGEGRRGARGLLTRRRAQRPGQVDRQLAEVTHGATRSQGRAGVWGRGLGPSCAITLVLSFKETGTRRRPVNRAAQGPGSISRGPRPPRHGVCADGHGSRVTAGVGVPGPQVGEPARSTGLRPSVHSQGPQGCEGHCTGAFVTRTRAEPRGPSSAPSVAKGVADACGRPGQRAHGDGPRSAGSEGSEGRPGGRGTGHRGRRARLPQQTAA